MAAEVKVQLKLLDVLIVLEDFKNIVDMNGSIYR